MIFFYNNKIKVGIECLIKIVFLKILGKKKEIFINKIRLYKNVSKKRFIIVYWKFFVLIYC